MRFNFWKYCNTKCNRTRFINRMEDEKIHIIGDLLCKSWAGTITSAEQAMLDELLNEDALEHLQEDLGSDRYVMGRFKEYSKYDAREDFKSFLSKVEEPEPKKGSTRRLWFRWGYAASIVLLVLGGVFFYMLGEKDVKDENRVRQVAQQTEFPKVARLILSDQEVVTLDEVNHSMQLDSLGVVFSKGPRVLDYTRVKKGDTDSSSFYHTLVVPKGCLYKVVLSDGTRVTLNADSKMRYPVVFASGKREVYLDGEAYFDVTKNERVPFFVTSKNFSVRVLGTSFNVMNYDDEEMANVTLLSGSVEMMTRDTTVRMIPGEQVVMRQDQLVGMEKVNPLPYISWMEDKFCFENERLEVILRKLSRWYDVSVLYVSPSVKDTRFSGYIPNDIGLKEVLELLQETTDITFSLQDSVISVKESRVRK